MKFQTLRTKRSSALSTYPPISRSPPCANGTNAAHMRAMETSVLSNREERVDRFIVPTSVIRDESSFPVIRRLWCRVPTVALVVVRSAVSSNGRPSNRCGSGLSTRACPRRSQGDCALTARIRTRNRQGVGYCASSLPLCRLLLSCGDERQVTRFGSDTRGRSRVVTGGHPRHQHHLLGHPGAELLPFAQRHDAVAGARALSHPQELLRPELQPGRSDHPGLPVHGLHAATLGRPLHRPPPTTVFPDGRHRPHPDRPAVDVPSLGVSRDPARRHVDRDGLVDLPSRSLPRGAHGGRRTLWARPVPVPGRRERRLGLRPIARRIRRRPTRAVEHCVVLGVRR